MILRVFASVVGVGLIAVAWLIFSADTPTNPAALARASEQFTLEVLPVLQAKCLACHGADPEKIEGGLDLTSQAGLLRGGESEEPVVVPGDTSKGLLLQAIRRTGLEMPPKQDDRLTEAQIAVFEKWIADGAIWPSEEQQLAIRTSAWQESENEEGILVQTSGGLADDWTYRRYQPENLWAYQPIQKPQLESSAKNPIDVLVDRQLERLRLEPAPRADPLTLIRRITFDVIGLPPTPEEVQEFLTARSDDAEQAWADVIDRLLASAHYGEQAARHWLDVVRYADSGGFANDWQRPNAWRYRDYVIRSFNEDKPYDQFVMEQLAGDELNVHDPEMKIAVGFLRMGPWEHSAMSVPKISRQQFLDDVTDAVGQVFLAHPLQCARCHDHKFDPIPTRDYYSLQAVFATTQLADVDVPWLPEENTTGMPEDREAHQQKLAWNQQVRAQLQRRIQDEQRAWFHERGLPFKSREAAKAADVPPESLPDPRVGLSADELGQNTISRKWQQRFEWEATRYQPLAHSVYVGKTKLPNGVTKPIRLPADPLAKGQFEQTAILTGGDPFSPGTSVTPGVLTVANGGELRRITRQPNGRRLALAEWLVSPANPLTARVMVNRIWQSHFGRGLVATSNNFGAMGKKPTHPDLLDFLAATFVEQGWSIKEMHRLILTSEVYRRGSHHPDAQLFAKLDPGQEFLAVFRPRRLVAEEIRDAMLTVSGELNPDVGGIPIRPDMNLEVALQPRLIMGTFAPAYVPNASPAQRNRRSIYALKLRGLRDPFFEVFNQPSSDIPCEMRDESNVTPQVFSLLNSQESADRSLALAKRLIDVADSDEDAIEQLFWLVYGRLPLEAELLATLEHWHQMEKLQAKLAPQTLEYPTQIVRRANEEMSGEQFQFVERLFEYENYIPDLQPDRVNARTRGLADICLMFMNSNEFVYLY